MDQNRWLTWRPSLEHLHIIIPSLTPLQIHRKVHLRINRGAGQTFNRSHNTRLNKSWQIVHPSEEGKFHHRIPDVAIVQLLNEVGPQVTKDLSSIGNEEFSTSLGGLETDKCRSTWSTCADEFIVHPNEEVFTTFLIDRLVDWGVLISIDGRPGRDGVERIETCLHPECLVEFDKSILLFHQVEFTKDDSAVVHHLLLNFHGMFPDVSQLSINIATGETNVG